MPLTRSLKSSNIHGRIVCFLPYSHHRQRVLVMPACLCLAQGRNPVQDLYVRDIIKQPY